MATKLSIGFGLALTIAIPIIVTVLGCFLTLISPAGGTQAAALTSMANQQKLIEAKASEPGRRW